MALPTLAAFGTPANGDDRGSGDVARSGGRRNATPDRLHITDAKGNVLVLAPLERRNSAPELEPPWSHLIRRGIVVSDEDTIHWVQGDDPEKQHRFTRRIAQVVMLILTLVVSAAVPSIAESQNLLEIRAPLVLLTFVAVSTAVPGLLFFMFDRQRLNTLRDRFEQQIFRLDPNVCTLSDVYARYGSQINEAYFAPDGKTTIGQATQRRGPVVLATFTLGVGWVVALTTVRLSQSTAEPSTVTEAVQNPVAFAFLGAYFFSVNLCLRRYSRNDLRPKAYSAITVRVLTSIILAYLLHATVTVQPDNPVLLAAAFLTGIVPETAFTLLRETFRNRAIKQATTELQEPQPLRSIEGIDIYDRSRLLDEGVSNIEALAHDDLVDLLLETRIPAGRLVDWVDQAILCLHLLEPQDVTADAGATTPGTQARSRLRSLGITGASGLMAAYDHECLRGALI